MSRKSRFMEWGYSSVIAVISLIMVYPLLFMIINSFKNNKELFSNYWGLPTVFRYENYVRAWVDGKLSMYAYNSVLVTVTATLAALIMSTMLSYAIVKLRFKGANIVFLCILFAMFIPDEMNIVPRFLLLNDLGLIGTHWNLFIVYAVGALGMSTFILRNFMLSIPGELAEAAAIDGSGDWGVFFKIYVPLVVPVLLSVTILIINGIWGEYVWALVSVTDDKLRTLPIGLTVFQSLHGSNYGPLMAGLCIMTIPIIVLFTVFTRQFVEGMTSGTVKG
ncbi:carbohydrate ABC transporter permease [Paenibacillus mendelii]|uniref:Carbohydrate ABC transporter permease n=1 Tax=Paenibacillus mendelii TaxID=206163 RepID=A0ABV6JB28_9BACL|nr:carbohydrate ABC transporter permease [Paenibacillus mendelii]MCQ6562974.1 carbohydrate ABC transporter permease [Paenibacillus mendelii]